MGNKIRRINFFGTIDVAAIAEYLESMVEKGYFFTGCTGIFYTFEKGTPQKRKYHVELFHDGSVLGSAGDNEETRAFASQWEENGWKYIYTNGRQIFFVTDDMDAESVNVGNKERWQVIKKAIRGEVALGLIWVPLCLMNIFSFSDAWPTEFIENGTLDLVWISLLIFWAGSFLRNLLFYVKNKQRVAKGQSVVFPKGFHSSWFHTIMILFLTISLVFLLVSLCFESKETFIFVIITVAIIIVIVWFGIKLIRNIGGKKTRVQQIIILVVLAIVACAVAIIIAFTSLFFDDNDKRIEYLDGYGNTITESVSNDEIPLTINDLGINTSGLIQADSVCDECVTIYGTVKDCYQNYYDQHGEIASSLTYNIAYCRFGWVKDKLLENDMTTDYYGEDADFTDDVIKMGVDKLGDELT